MAKVLYEWDYSSYPGAKAYPHIFSPIGLGNLHVPNRVKYAATEDNFNDHEGFVTDQDVEYMRFRHMDLLKDSRSDVIRSGLKGGITLAGCADCHHNREFFCDRCHEKASVSLDCWGCHYYLTASELEELEGGGG